jgi:hypothetical protein
MTNQTQTNLCSRTNAAFAAALLPWNAVSGPALVGGIGAIGKRWSELQVERNN